MKPRDVATVLFVTMVWGVAFVGIKEVLETAPPLTVAGLRFFLAGIILLPIAVTGRGSRGRSPTRKEVITVALLQTTALYGLAFLGVQRATAGAAALLLNTNPLWVAVLSVPLLGAHLRLAEMAGIVLAIAGVIVISFDGSLGSPLGIALLLTGALAWAGGSIAVKRAAEADLVALSCAQMLTGSLPLLALGAGFEHTLPRFDAEGAWWFAMLVVVATAVNFVLWFGLLRRYGAVPMTTWLFLIPVFGVVAGAVLLDEPLGWRLVVGGLLVVIGVLIANRRAAPYEIILEGP